jgi:hypothetical protein
MAESGKAFGLDLAGYTSGKSGFARAARRTDGTIRVRVFQGHAFSRKLAGHDPGFSEVVNQERALVRRCLASGTLYVDVPIDLQGLPVVAEPRYAWQLIKRPVDYAIGGLPALASLIGAPAARFLNVLREIDSLENLLGSVVFETYPAASLDAMALPSKGYKGQTISISGAEVAVIQCPQGKEPRLDVIARGLNLRSETENVLSDDDVDAIVCALTGVLDEDHRLQGHALLEIVRRQLREKLGGDARLLAERMGQVEMLPQGYVLLGLRPDRPIWVSTQQRDIKRPIR